MGLFDRCRSCEHKDEKIQLQKQTIAKQKADLKRLRARTRELEDALREMCDYAEVCKHSPARPVLEKAV